MITLIGAPISTNAIYKFVCRGKFPNMYMTNEGKQLKQFYQLQAKLQHKKKATENDIEIIVKLFFKDQRRRDIDNYSKILLDSLTGIIWKDDKQIQKMTIQKFIDSQKPRIEIEIL